MGLHCHTDETSSKDEPQHVPEGEEGTSTPPETTSPKGSRVSDGEEEPREERTPKEQPRCEICGITTTSQAHLEVNFPGFRCLYHGVGIALKGYIFSRNPCDLCLALKQSTSQPLLLIRVSTPCISRLIRQP